nr:MAG TPA: hypothetical protein [Caudoviricetes sp.]
MLAPSLPRKIFFLVSAPVWMLSKNLIIESFIFFI